MFEFHYVDLIKEIGTLGKIISIDCCVLFLNFSQYRISSLSSPIGDFH